MSEIPIARLPAHWAETFGGDTIALAPPLPITPSQIDDLFALVAETIEEVADL